MESAESAELEKYKDPTSLFAREVSKIKFNAAEALEERAHGWFLRRFWDERGNFDLSNLFVAIDQPGLLWNCSPDIGKGLLQKNLYGTNTFSQPLLFVATIWFQPSSFATIIQYHILFVATCVDKRRQSQRFNFGLSSCSIWKPADAFSHTKWECGFCWLGLAWEHVGISYASSYALRKSWGEPHAIRTNSENVSGKKSYTLMVFCWADWLFKSFC